MWELRVYLGCHSVTGKRTGVSRTFRGGQRAVSKALAQLFADSDEIRPEACGKHQGGDAMTVAELLDRWQQLRLAEWSRTTANEHAGTTWWYDALSATSVRKIHTVLHAALEDAVALELNAGNPSTKARRAGAVARRDPP